MKRYTSSEIHWKLIDHCLSDRYREVEQIGSQALMCPYYVPMEGRLGSDWGVIVNPESSRFGLVTFEHDDCGCPKREGEDAEGWDRHADDPSQDVDIWHVDWKHNCDEWRDTPCDMRAAT